MKPERRDSYQPDMNATAQPMAGFPIPLFPPAARHRERVTASGSPGLSAAERARVIRRLRWLARLLDDAVTIPGTRYSVGLDPVIGLAPGVGDAISVALSAYIIFEGKRLGASKHTLTMMVGNVALDFLSGSIPVIGDLVDAGFKANQRNLRLLGIEPARPGDEL